MCMHFLAKNKIVTSILALGVVVGSRKYRAFVKTLRLVLYDMQRIFYS
jgi:hypothetical protein